MIGSPPTCEVAARSCDNIRLKVAATKEERTAAFRLTYQAYSRSGLCESNPEQIRFTPYQLLPSTDIFIARLREEVICTMSLVRDGALGLPLEQLYAEEVARRRYQGLRLAEVSCLADRRSEADRFFGLFCDLSRLMVQLAEAQCVDQLLIAVHPRHAPLYRRYMAFKRIGEQRDYAAVRGNPAVPLCLDLNEIRASHPKNWWKFFGEELPPEVLEPRPMSEADRDYFAGLLDESHQRELFAGMGAIGPEQEAVLCA